MQTKKKKNAVRGAPLKNIPLTSKEKSELAAEAIITLIVLIMLNITILFTCTLVLNQTRSSVNSVLNLRTSLFQIFQDDPTGWKNILLLLALLVFDGVVFYWRMHNRYKTLQLQHIIKELHYIANNHYNHRIPFELDNELGKVIDSINILVANTQQAMAEERRIEQSKDELISNVSHDIRTPLTSIIGYLGLIEEKQYKNQEELLKYTQTAYQKAKQMKILVDDLFEYTKVRQPSTPVQPTLFDMEQLLEQLAADFELEASKKDITITVFTTPSPFLMEADAEKLVRVFNNLLTNALKYGHGCKQIIMTVEQVDSKAVITVKNDGEPIPSASLKLLFDRFYRVEESRSKETGGTGLGLAIAESIVSLHHGKIYAESDAEWTSFIMELPLKYTEDKSKEETKKEKNKTDQKESRSKKRI